MKNMYDLSEYKLNDQTLLEIRGGSNDDFWTGVGYYAHAFFNTHLHSHQSGFTGNHW